MKRDDLAVDLRVEVTGLDSIAGLIVDLKFLLAREEDVKGTIIGFVGDRFGDAVWVRHDGDERTVAAYRFSELEPLPVDQQVLPAGDEDGWDEGTG